MIDTFSAANKCAYWGSVKEGSLSRAETGKIIFSVSVSAPKTYQGVPETLRKPHKSKAIRILHRNGHIFDVKFCVLSIYEVSRVFPALLDVFWEHISLPARLRYPSLTEQKQQQQLTGSGHVLTRYPLKCEFLKKKNNVFWKTKINWSNFFVSLNYELRFG